MKTLPSPPMAWGSLVVLLAPDALPKVYSLAAVPETDMQVNGHKLLDSGLGDWLGFYDWLRDASGTAAGVCLWVDDWHAHIESLRKCMNVTIGKNQELSVYFDADRASEPFSSHDQDFGENKLFVGKDVYALTFNAPRNV